MDNAHNVNLMEMNADSVPKNRHVEHVYVNSLCKQLA